MKRGPEAKLKAAVIPALKASGLMWWRNNSAMVPISFPGQKTRFMQVGTKGLPDIMLVGKDGCLWCLELKAPKGKLSDDQKKFRSGVMGTSIHFFVVRTEQQASEIIAAALGEPISQIWLDVYEGKFE